MDSTSFYRLKLHNFRWRGHNSSGKKVSGQILAYTECEVRDRLSNQKIHIQKIKRRSVSFFERVSNKVSAKDILIFSRQMATMLDAGVPMIQALKMLMDNQNKAEMKSILRQLSSAVEAGTPLSRALATTSIHFDNFYVDLIATGEQTGHLSQIFDRLATYQEKSALLKSKVKKAMIYPAMVSFTALLVSYLMLTFVIPEFETMFAGLGANLPWFTQQVLNLSHVVQAQGWKLFCLLIALTLCLRAAKKRSYALRLIIARYVLVLPIIGAVLTKASLAKFSRTLAISFSSGIPILSGIETSSKTANNLYFQKVITKVLQDTAAGMPIYLAMRNSNAFPEMMLQMVMIGEESGRLDNMLNKVADVYENEVDDTVDNLGKLLEPIIILVLGGLIGGLVIAMYLPIFNLMSVIG
ncbi:type II secretion system F family protein [Vibrio tapetis]|uniref:Type IV pilin assembly protein PilC n=1 Tax=Vibrio tapetis subsp. tapetis TaxID=1671868 RepID=A0A2N8Z8L8_9VIBR|nr:type II secretion system F family protein [Vibrio tapetis]SON48230.1 Type IV pilin assembly protein PilC [Vibrio tapetis subsp. tapetis]